MNVSAICLMGPTASGKTSLALEIGSKSDLQLEIVSVDSALIYKDMNIGSAKPSIQELGCVPHHLIDIITPLETYSVANFIDDATKLINNINAQGKIPLLVGGTMMYYYSLINGISSIPGRDEAIRTQLEIKAQHHGIQSLYEELLKADPLTASKISSTDSNRIIRALEVFYITGEPISKLQLNNHKPDINFLNLAIMPNDRTMLHKTINDRFLHMLQQGLVEEVASLQKLYPTLTNNHTSMKCVGYAQTWQYLENEITWQELIDLSSAATRNLAKRQMTWIRKINPTIISNDYKQILHQIDTFIDVTK